MLIPTLTEFPELIVKSFDQMQIPGDGEGLAIRREVMLEGVEIAIGINSSGIPVAVKSGKSGRGSQKHKTIPIPRFQEALSTLDRWIDTSGLLADEDVLDGVSYLVKRRTPRECIRFLICTTSLQEDESIRRCTRELDNILSTIR